MVDGVADTVGRVEASCLLAVEAVRSAILIHDGKQLGWTYDLALIFLLLRFRRRTRFFLHLALILNGSCERRC